MGKSIRIQWVWACFIILVSIQFCCLHISDKVFEELSISVSRFNHSLVASGCLGDKLQDSLLSQLGISLNSGDHWPLTVFPRSLAVLAEILLLRQQREREAKKMISQSETAVVNIWLRFMETVSRSVLKADSKPDPNEGNVQ